MPVTETLGPLRHRCLMSGGCCQGNIALVDAEEQRHIEHLARRFSVSNPVADHAIRKTEDGCVFLDSQQRCRIHSTALNHKPATCKQYPIVGVQTESALRIGIDPGCLSAHLTWEQGPEVSISRLKTSKRELPLSLSDAEDRVLDLLVTEQSISKILMTLTSAESVEAFSERLIHLVRNSKLQQTLEREGTPRLFKEQLLPVLCSTQERETPPRLVLSDTMQRWSIEAAQRMLYLRFLVLSGAILSAMADPREEVWGPRFAVWNRILRSPVTISTLFPSQSELEQLLGHS